MPGYNPQQVANNARNANTVAIAIGQELVAFAQTVSHSFGYGAEGLYGVGSPKPQEIQQLKVGPTITVDTFALTQNGINLLAGGQNLAYLLGGNQFDLYILDGLNNDAALFVYTGSKASGFSENIPANAPIRDTFTFLALDVLDPNGNSLLTTGENALAVASASASALGNGLGL
jgi:hypothetical protein